MDPNTTPAAFVTEPVSVAPAVPSTVAPKFAWAKVNTTLEKVAVTFLWVAVSSILGFAVAWEQKNVALFGLYAPVINMVLVALKNLVDPNVPNV